MAQFGLPALHDHFEFPHLRDALISVPDWPLVPDRFQTTYGAEHANVQATQSDSLVAKSCSDVAVLAATQLC